MDLLVELQYAVVFVSFETPLLNRPFCWQLL